jgi:hypothetical protein
MKSPIWVLAILAVTGCNGSLADFWRAPVKSKRAKPAPAPAIVVITGRMGLLLNDTVPRQVAPNAGERINVAETAPLGDGLWLVRTRVALEGAMLPLRRADGSLVEQSVIDQALLAAPKAVLGLLLNSDLIILEDQQGKGRKGRITRCDGDPVAGAYALRACLVLAAHRGVPAIETEAVEPLAPASAPEDTAAALVDVQQRVDGGPPAGGDEGATP